MKAMLKKAVPWLAGIISMVMVLAGVLAMITFFQVLIGVPEKNYFRFMLWMAEVGHFKAGAAWILAAAANGGLIIFVSIVAIVHWTWQALGQKFMTMNQHYRFLAVMVLANLPLMFGASIFSLLCVALLLSGAVLHEAKRVGMLRTHRY